MLFRSSKKILTLALAILSISFAFAQKVTVPEPEFSDQTYLLTSNTEYVKLPRETGVVKTKAGASVYLTGIGKVKTRISLPGTTSSVAAKQGGDVRLIIKAANNATDPNSFISIFKFEVKGKERRAQLAESGTFSGSKSNSLGQIEFQAKKYGTSSYLIVIENREPGEYRISLGDPDKLNEKNSMKITTFSVQKP